MSLVELPVSVCVVGGGPAGVMTGLLLARSGIDVVVLEKHEDFFRDFRGDTVHPSTLELLNELGLIEKFLQCPHQKVKQIKARFGDEALIIGDFTSSRSRYPYIALIPQWDFLDLLAQEAKSYPSFRLLMGTEAEGLLEENSRVVGVRARGRDQEFEIRANLVIGADGRHSIVREKAGLPVQEIGAPMDVLWMRISRERTDPGQPFICFDRGQALVMINRDRYFQCGFLIEKGSVTRVKEQGLASFRRRVSEMAPFLGDRVEELKSWDDIKLLSVSINRLRQWWRPGLLCIGDAAHAMSPVGGIGINLAIQDAVAAANILAKPLRAGTLNSRHLARVQRRRFLSVWIAQAFQRVVQKRVIGEALSAKGLAKPPWFLRLLNRWSFLRRMFAYWIGHGVRPEHVRTLVMAPIHVSRPVSADLR